MLKKSLILGTLLVSTAFGAELPESSDPAIVAAPSSVQTESCGEALDLASILRMKSDLSPARVAHTPELKAHAIAQLTKAAAALRSNPMMAEGYSTIISGVGHVLLGLGENDAAVDLFKFVLTLDRGIFGFSMAQTCLALHQQGETDLAITTLKSLISDDSLSVSVREEAVLYFYWINKEVHRNEARDMLANLLVKEGKVATMEEARKTASEEFPTDEESAARRAAFTAAREAAESDLDNMPSLEGA